MKVFILDSVEKKGPHGICPVCAREASERSFTCRTCGRGAICRDHFVDSYECCTLCMRPGMGELVFVPGGEFLMGKEKKPIHVPPFFIDRFPVTNREYHRFVSITGHRAPKFWKKNRFAPGKEDHPVVGVSFSDALAYANWAGKSLPKEEEWEKAARGVDGRRFPWGKNFSKGRCNNRSAGLKDTSPVDSFPEGKSPYGCMDMAGNVWEWTGTPSERGRGRMILKGGSWYDYPPHSECHARFSSQKEFEGSSVGFRCVAHPGEYIAIDRERIREEQKKKAGFAPNSYTGKGATEDVTLGEISLDALYSSSEEFSRTFDPRDFIEASGELFDTGDARCREERQRSDFENAKALLAQGERERARALFRVILEREGDNPLGKEAATYLERLEKGTVTRVPLRRRSLERRIFLLILLFAVLVVAAVGFPKSRRISPDPVETHSRVSKKAQGNSALKSPKGASLPRTRLARSKTQEGRFQIRKARELLLWGKEEEGVKLLKETLLLDPQNREAKRILEHIERIPEGMVYIPGGPFIFGEDSQRSLEPFYMDRCEVTNFEYQKFVTESGYPLPPHWNQGKVLRGLENHPVTFVNFFDAEAFARWAEKRIPTEEEWEKAARGASGQRYPWGESLEKQRCNVLRNAPRGMPGTMQAGSFKNGQSPYGCLDMVGNVLEWTSTVLVSEKGEIRALKGGSFGLIRDFGSCTYQYTLFKSGTRNGLIGFRCAKDVSK